MHWFCYPINRNVLDENIHCMFWCWYGLVYTHIWSRTSHFHMYALVWDMLTKCISEYDLHNEWIYIDESKNYYQYHSLLSFLVFISYQGPVDLWNFLLSPGMNFQKGHQLLKTGQSLHSEGFQLLWYQLESIVPCSFCSWPSQLSYCVIGFGMAWSEMACPLVIRS